jgi:hypothetical protein
LNGDQEMRGRNKEIRHMNNDGTERNLNGKRQVRVWNVLATESGRCWQLVEMSHVPVIEDDQMGYAD